MDKISFEFKRADAARFKCDLLAVPVFAANKKDNKKGKKSKGGSHWQAFAGEHEKQLKSLDVEFSGELQRELKLHKFSGKVGSHLDVHGGKNSRVLMLSGIDRSLESWRRLGASLVRQASHVKAVSAGIALSAARDSKLEDIVQAIAEGAILGAYDFRLYRKPIKAKSPLKVTFLLAEQASSKLGDAIKRAELLSTACYLARDMVNTPAADLQPKDLVAFAKKVAKGSGAVSAKVFNRSALRRMGADALLGVAKASAAEPFLIHMTYRPRKKIKNQRTIVLVGKGVTFDSGGLSIKTGKGMEEMKCDMAGAACVLAVMQALSKMPAKEAPQDVVHVIVPTAENMINGNGLRPGDILRAVNKKTIEVLNTDAEGRLLLADAFGYAEKLKADIMIDVATLTGACVVALGSDYAGLFANNQNLAERLKACGERTGEKLWQLPLAEEYEGMLKSPVADLKNTGSPGPGAITAALFLQHFVAPGVKWAHLDIAGPAFTAKAGHYTKPGGTAFGVRALVEFLRQPEV